MRHHSGTGHPPTHPGGQGSSVPHQRDLSSVGRRCGPPPLPVRRGAHPSYYIYPPPPSGGGTPEHKALETAPETRLLDRHGMSPTQWGGDPSTPQQQLTLIFIFLLKKFQRGQLNERINIIRLAPHFIK